MRVIFLDIDGVLNTAQTPTTDGHRAIDPVLLGRFCDLLDRTQAKVVISSSWRCKPNEMAYLDTAGVPHIDTLPVTSDPDRAMLIKQWVSAHPQCRAYAVLDDADEREGLPLFKTNPDVGLTSEIVEAVIRYFNETDHPVRPPAQADIGLR